MKKVKLHETNYVYIASCIKIIFLGNNNGHAFFFEVDIPISCWVCLMGASPGWVCRSHMRDISGEI